MSSGHFDEMKRLVGFGPAETRLLGELLPRVEPEAEDIVREFYDVVESSPEAHAVVLAHSSRERLSATMHRWILEFLRGPHDYPYYVRRRQIGLVHVRIGLPPHYPFVTVNVLRRRLNLLARPDQAVAVDKLMDLELSIMNEVYWEHLMSALRRRERLATIGELAGSMAHEIRNPLAAIQNATFYLRGRMPEANGRTARHLEVIERKVLECGRVIDSMLEFAQDRTPMHERMQLQQLIRGAAQEIEDAEGVEMVLDLPEGAVDVTGDPVQLRGMFRNLLTNAVQALAGSGRVRVTITSGGPPDRVRVTVFDNGPGIHPEVQASLFEPLVTTKTYGLGLGLAYVHRVVEAHGGLVRARTTEDGETAFAVELPRAGAM